MRAPHRLLPIPILIAAVAWMAADGVLPRCLAQEAPPESVTLVSYNLRNYLDMDRRVDGESKRDAPKPDEEIEPMIRILAEIDPDILGVCELGVQKDLDDFHKRLAGAGLEYPYRELVQASDPDRHLALLSRFPITATDHQTNLSYVIDDIELSFGRGILDATVTIGEDYRLRLLGLHLKSKRPMREADEALMRRNEARLLRKHVDEILAEDPEVNLLAFGDFNDSRNEPPIKDIQGRFGSKRYLRDLQLADNLGYRWTYYWSFADQYSRFDFIFVNNGLYPEIDLEASRIHADRDWLTASDHRPLVIQISPVDREIPGDE